MISTHHWSLTGSTAPSIIMPARLEDVYVRGSLNGQPRPCVGGWPTRASARRQSGQAAPQPAHRLRDPLLVLDEREPHVPVPAWPEPDPGRDRDVAVTHEQLSELDRAQVRVGLGDLGPGEHRAPGLEDVPADATEPVDQCVAPRLIHGAELGRVVGGLVERHGRRDLDRLERAVVEVALELRERDVVLVHDLAYADMCFDGWTPP